MQIFSGLADVPAGFGPSVLTIGNFDGVHAGHVQVLGTVVQQARARNADAVAVTFNPHPAHVHRPETAPAPIMGLDERLRIIAGLGIDATLVIHYTLEFAKASPEEFVRSVFVQTLGASAVVVGHDVRFGNNNAGDLATMKELGGQYGFEVIALDDFGNGERYSSTQVRKLLSAGDVSAVRRILGRNHAVTGVVVRGAARGRELGFPTANLSPDAQGYIPADGVYAGWLVDQDGTRWPAAISVGSNPTFQGVSRQVEAFVINRPKEKVEDFDLYGQRVRVEFVQRLRPMLAYTGRDDLVAQMRRDVAQSRRSLENVQLK